MDYATMERRILAQLKDGEATKDPHREWAAERLGIDPEDVTPEQREAAKRLRFAEMYGRPFGHVRS
jgi:DNA polymerase I-like protein with 3'-5' exonuclease and polymerase domains